MLKHIAIIIVGYNSKKYLTSCFSSVYQSTFKEFMIIFVDNNSTDDSANYIEKYFPKIAIIKNKKNFGFAKANNVGIRKAIKLGYRYFFILNPDTILDKNCIKNLLMQANQNTILQPLILLHKNGKKTNLINTSGNVLHYLGFSWCGDYFKNRSKFNGIKEKEITSASGAGMLLPIKIFQATGGFDELFFMYYEDLDLCWRARMAGFNIKLSPQALMWHKYQFSKNKNKMFYAERNRLMFLLKNFSVKYLLLIFPIFIINEFCIILYSLLLGKFFDKIKSYFLIFINRKKIKKIKFKNLNESFKKSKNLVYPKISFSEINTPLLVLYNILLKIYWNIIYCLV